MTRKAFISGCHGLTLSVDEREFFTREKPWGFILFSRNIDSPEQVCTLVNDLRACVGRTDAPVLVDQEGGRVRRLREPHWPYYPPSAVFGQLYRYDQEAGLLAAWKMSRLMAHDLCTLGISVNCMPVLDLLIQGASSVIGDRSYGCDPHMVGNLGRKACEGLLAGSILPVIKHIPGHGRARFDSHKSLPVIDASLSELEKTDFVPFSMCSDMPMAMTAHLVYTAIDAYHPATQSTTLIHDIIRGKLDFDGLLLSDDISMNALSGDIRTRSTLAFAAGCDIVLHCNGKMAEMQEVAEASPPLRGKTQQRADGALSCLKPVDDGYDAAALRNEFEALLSGITNERIFDRF